MGCELPYKRGSRKKENSKTIPVKSMWSDGMYVLKFKGDLVWQTSGSGEWENPLEFELEVILAKRLTPMLVYGEVHHRIKKTLGLDQLDALTFASLLEKLAQEIRDVAAES
jgi:hypothetical protein